MLDVHQSVISPSETPAPSMPVDAQGMTFEADTIEALKAALKEYHETQIAPSLNHIHQILQQHRVAIPKDVATRLKLLDLSSNMAELAVTRRSLLLTNLPAFVTWPAVTQNLDWLMQKVGLQRDSDIQSITQHMYSADKTVLRVTFVTESACKSVHQFLRTRPYYWHDRSSYDDIKIKTERDFTTAERIQRIPLFTLLDFFGHADMAPYKNISLACDWNTLQVWLPVTSTNEEKLIAQVVYLPIDPKPLCAFFVESTHHLSFQDQFVPLFTKATRSALTMIQALQFAMTSSTTQIRPHFSKSMDISTLEDSQVLSAFPYDIRFLDLSPEDANDFGLNPYFQFNLLWGSTQLSWTQRTEQDLTRWTLERAANPDVKVPRVRKKGQRQRQRQGSHECSPLQRKER